MVSLNLQKQAELVQGTCQPRCLLSLGCGKTPTSSQLLSLFPSVLLPACFALLWTLTLFMSPKPGAPFVA